MKLYRLASVYEFDKKIDNSFDSVRIEIFEEIGNEKIRRVRVSAKRVYKLLPFLSDNGEELENQMHSSDLLSIDISNIVIDDLSLLKGKIIEESEMLKSVIDSVNKLSENFNES